MRRTRRPRWLTVSIVCLAVFLLTSFALMVSADGDAAEAAPSSGTVFTLDDVEYDLSDSDSAHDYVDGYADNLNADPQFEAHLESALATVRESIPQYATIWALLPPVIAIVLALITKEVYSSLFVGILAGGLIYSSFNFEGTVVHVVSDGFVASLADSYNVGILLFLVMLGALVAMMNKAGGSAAFRALGYQAH